MAQKKKAPAKSPGKAKPKVHAAASAKPARKMDTKAAKASKPVTTKVSAKPALKSKSAPKPQASAVKKPVPAKVAKTVNKTASKTPDKKPAVVVAPPVKAATKPAAAPLKVAAPLKAAAGGKPAAPVTKPAASTKPVASAVPPAAAKPAMAQPAKPAAAAPKVASGKPAVVPVFRAGPVQFGVSAPAARTVPSALPKPAVRTFPAPGVATGGAAPAMPRDIAQKAVDARQQQVAGAMAGGPKKQVTQRHGFKINESIVYPAHGVGRIIGIEEQEIAGMLLELFVIQFEKDKMTLKVPSGKLQTVGMRKLAEDDIVGKAMETLKGRARVKRTMWSRRAQEYETKINSGDLVQISEVVRDLYRSESQPEQSYSERQLYEAALDRMAREIAAVARIDERGAVQRITEVLAKSAKGRRAAEVQDAVDAGDAEGESDAKAA